MKIICTICARGSSKGVPRKNLRKILGKPLIAYTIEQALQWGKADRIIVSTDSPEIAEVAVLYGAEVPFLRPGHLAADTAPKLPVIQHAVNYVEQESGVRFDYVVDLDPTSPLRSVEDIDLAFNQLVNHPDAYNLYSVTKASKSPYFNMVEVNKNGYSYLSKHGSMTIARRQDAPEVYEMNASIYIYRRDPLMSAESVHLPKTLIYEMPEDRSRDIDTELDFKIVELLLKEKIFGGNQGCYRDIFNLAGRVAVVTGAAGLLGKEMVKGLFEYGATVIAADISYDQKRDLPEVLDRAVYLAYVDITDKQSVTGLIKRLKRIDIWINNAYPRTDEWMAKFEDVAYESFQKNINMHLNGYFLCCQAVAAKMKEQREGIIINMGSIYGLLGPNFNLYERTDLTTPVAYSAIKGGIINLTRYLASYLGKYNIRVNALAPGGIYDSQPAAFVEAYERHTPLQRMGKPEDVVGPLLYLVSDAAKYITGQVVVVDGGFTII